MRKSFSTSKNLFQIDQIRTKQNKNIIFDDIMNNYLKRYMRKKSYYYYKLQKYIRINK